MRPIIVIAGLLLSTTVFANNLENLTTNERCGLWSTNAMHGATQALRGAPRQIAYISMATLIEMVEHFGAVGIDKIYILDDPDYTREEREFLESSTLFGYDAMSKWQATYEDDKPRLWEWIEKFEAECFRGQSEQTRV
jgi:hypothetical protein